MIIYDDVLSLTNLNQSMVVNCCTKGQNKWFDFFIWSEFSSCHSLIIIKTHYQQPQHAINQMYLTPVIVNISSWLIYICSWFGWHVDLRQYITLHSANSLGNSGWQWFSATDAEFWLSVKMRAFYFRYLII